MTREVPPEVVDHISWHDVKELDEHGEGLSQWEIDFVESLLQQLRASRRLTKKQRNRLDEIRDKRL